MKPGAVLRLMWAALALMPAIAAAQSIPPPGCSWSTWSRAPELCAGAASAPAAKPAASAPAAKPGCAARKAPAWTGKHGYYCRPVPGRMIPARPYPFTHDVRADRGLDNEGWQSWSCQPTPAGYEWVLVRSSCKPRG